MTNGLSSATLGIQFRLTTTGSGMIESLKMHDFAKMIETDVVRGLTPEVVEEQLKVWSVDPDALAELSYNFHNIFVKSVSENPDDVEVAILALFVTGFTLGFMSSIEVETRRQLDASP